MTPLHRTLRIARSLGPVYRWTPFGWILFGAGALLLVWIVAWLRFPSDRTPEGAYLRVVKAVNRGESRDFFAYIETRAQHSCYTIGDYRARARARIESAFPGAERERALQNLAPIAQSADGPDVFAAYAEREGWIERLRRDLSGIQRVEQSGERATVETVRGTRYPFRLRDNGIWGLTLFTAHLVAEAERAARDLSLIEAAAEDYEKSKGEARH